MPTRFLDGRPTVLSAVAWIAEAWREALAMRRIAHKRKVITEE
jgi:hypothetical protein